MMKKIFTNIQFGGSSCNDNKDLNNLKVDLLPASPCCCSNQITPHMPTCDKSFDNYIPTNITSRKGGCVCLKKDVYKALSCRGGNGC